MTKKAKRQPKSEPIVTDFDIFCNLIAAGPTELNPNSRSIRLLRRCIHQDQYNGKRACFEDFSARVNDHVHRDSLISEIVASWYHQQYLPMWELYWQESQICDGDPKFLLRKR
jgi:hypothetical protein